MFFSHTNLPAAKHKHHRTKTQHTHTHTSHTERDHSGAFSHAPAVHEKYYVADDDEQDAKAYNADVMVCVVWGVFYLSYGVSPTFPPLLLCVFSLVWGALEGGFSPPPPPP
jgi:hypothetical protein